MANTFDQRRSALRDAISYLNTSLESEISKNEREIVRRQLELLKRARDQDVEMAEKIAESFGFHSHEECESESAAG